MKKTHRQDACSTSHPPSTGPIAVVIAVNPDHVPIARPRSFSGKEALMRARLPGMRSAAPTPWKPRAMISIAMEDEKPHHVDPSAKINTPMTKNLRRP